MDVWLSHLMWPCDGFLALLRRRKFNTQTRGSKPFFCMVKSLEKVVSSIVGSFAGRDKVTTFTGLFELLTCMHSTSVV